MGDALSRKAVDLVTQLIVKKWNLLEQVVELNAEFRKKDKRLRGSSESTTVITFMIRKPQLTEPFLSSLIDRCKDAKHLDFHL